MILRLLCFSLLANSLNLALPQFTFAASNEEVTEDVGDALEGIENQKNFRQDKKKKKRKSKKKSSSFRHWAASLGGMTPYFSKTTSQTSGETSLYSTFYPQAGIQYRAKLTPRIHILGRLSGSFLGHESSDGSTVTFPITLSVSGLYRITAKFFAFGGPGVFINLMSGQGGSATLNNGTSYTTFARPSGLSTSKHLMMVAGVGLRIIPRLHVQIETLAQSFLSTRRSFGVRGGLTYDLF